MFLSKLFGKKLRIEYLKADDILPNPHRVRGEVEEADLALLAESVRQSGVLEPLAVERNDEGQFRLLSGERRLLAARRAGLAKVPCIVYPKREELGFLFPLVCSLHSRPNNVFEEAAALRKMTDSLRLSRHCAASKLGISESAAASRLHILKLNDIQRRKALDSGLDLRQIRAVADADPFKRDKMLDYLANPARFCPKETEADSKQKINGAADWRFFDNSLNRIVDSMCAAGLKATWESRNTPLGTEYVIRVAKDRSAERQLTLF